jgi:DNA-binding beta-propeller fold protein YncE
MRDLRLRRTTMVMMGSVSALALVLALAPWGGASLIGKVGLPAASPGVAPAFTTCPTGGSPMYSAFDPVNHYMYIPNFFTSNITVLKNTCTLVGTIALPAHSTPVAMAFDPANNEMYVTDSTNNAVYAISTLTVVGTVTSSLISAPWAITWDPGDSMLLVTDLGTTYNVVGISGSTVLGSTSTGSYPYGICYDPFYNSILVLNAASDNVTFLNAYSPLSKPTGSAPTGSEPRACAYSPATSEDYIVNYQSGNVTVMDGIGGGVTSITVGTYPTGIAWDQATLEMFVANHLKGSVSVISGTTVVHTLKGVAPTSEGATYDWQNNLVYVSSEYGYDVGLVS